MSFVKRKKEYLMSGVADDHLKVPDRTKRYKRDKTEKVYLFHHLIK